MKILFICTHNRCRSILAEAITDHIASGRLEAKSAGSQPVGEVHPLSLRYLAEQGISTEGLCSQSWDDHESWQPDIVITVCDSAAGEQCPLWFGQAIKAHWGLADPSKLQGTDEEIRAAFINTISIITKKVEQLLASNFEQLDHTQLQHLLDTLLAKTGLEKTNGYF